MIEATDEMLQVLKDHCKFYISDTDAIERIIELHEANKPKPEPVGYAWVVNNRVKMIADTELNSGFRPLYTTPPTQEPLTPEEIGKILFLCRKGTMFPYSFARDIEKAHGIT